MTENNNNTHSFLPKLSILINANSGYGKGQKIYRRIHRAMLKDSMLKNHICYLTYISLENSAKQFNHAMQHSDIIVICGGDGTIHQFINHIGDNSQDIAISIFPLGTGNDLYRNIGSKEKNILNLIYKLILQPQHLEVDLFSLNNAIYFINYISFGIEAYIINLYEQICNGLKKFFLFRFSIFHIGYLKKLLLFCIGLFAFLFYRKKICVIDSSKEALYTSIIIHNIKSYAGGSILNNDSLLNDGMLEVAFNPTKMHFFKLILNRFGLSKADISSSTHTLPLHFGIKSKTCIQVDGEDYTDILGDTHGFTICFKKRLSIHF